MACVEVDEWEGPARFTRIVDHSESVALASLTLTFAMSLLRDLLVLLQLLLLFFGRIVR